MKILWISQNLPFPPKTGVLQRNFNLISEASRFADIDLIAILKKDILPGFDEELAKGELGKLCNSVDVVRLPIEDSKLRFLAVVCISVITRSPFSVNWATSGRLVDAIRRKVATNDYDVAYVDTISLAQYRHILNSIPVILNHHNIESHLFKRRVPYERNILKRAYYRLEAHKLERYERENCGRFDVNFAVSQLDAERLLSIADDARTCVIANGVDTGYFCRTPGQSDPRRLIMVSGMNWFPNRDAVLYMLDEIWPRIVDEFPSAKLQIVGASPPHELINAARRDTRLEVTGFVDDVRPYMNSAAIYLCPMRDGGGTRLKILDALSMAMPIVATSMAIEGIGVEPEREVLIADTAAEFAEQTVRALREPELRDRLAKNGRSFVEQNFSWSVIRSALQKECSRLVSQRSVQYRQ